MYQKKGEFSYSQKCTSLILMALYSFGIVIEAAAVLKNIFVRISGEFYRSEEEISRFICITVIAIVLGSVITLVFKKMALKPMMILSSVTLLVVAISTFICVQIGMFNLENLLRDMTSRYDVYDPMILLAMIGSLLIFIKSYKQMASIKETKVKECFVI